ncbi:uncharacterized protein PG986_005057 [Apiospora aurea]|uniref:Uncharacterized protein n=1 Tax=Apiospora aurea TaxID=335848 RepID=A0ABR1QGH4_9PEZI
MPASVVAGKELDQYRKHFEKDEHIITLVPESAYSAQLEAARVDTLIRPSEPPRFDSYLWAYGVSADWAS